MSKIKSLAAVVLIASSFPVFAASRTSSMTPGHQMQHAFPSPSSRGMAHGASRFTPGHEMQHAFPTPGTRGAHHGASSFAPPRR
jgi:hypothetical protein